MKRVMVYLAAGTLVVVGVLLGARPLRQRFSDLRSDLAKVNADTGDVMASANYQRFATRREAVAAMKADLLSLAAAESAFVADSGRPTMNPPLSYWSAKGRGNYATMIRIERDRWVAKMNNLHTSMSCSITAMVDTMTWTYHAGAPTCAEWTPEESTAIAMDTAPAYGYTPVPDPPPAPPPGPRKHRDWGPVNNTPPPTPFIRRNTRPSGYSSYGRWVACSTVTAFRDKRFDAAPVFTVQRGEEFTTLTGDVHIESPGVVVFRHPISNPPTREGPEVDSIPFTPRDTLFLLNQIGEGYVLWWFRRQVDTGYQFWSDNGHPDFVADPSDTVALVRRAKVAWWVRARDHAARNGWIRHDYPLMATGGYMDEVERCGRKP